MQTFKIHEPSQISSRSFWDVRFEDLDFDRDKAFIIEKVMNYGIMSDFMSTLKYYGKDTIRQEIVKAAYLKKDVLNLCVFILTSPQVIFNGIHNDSCTLNLGAFNQIDETSFLTKLWIGWRNKSFIEIWA
jgi:hypothetical protein